MVDLWGAPAHLNASLETSGSGPLVNRTPNNKGPITGAISGSIFDAEMEAVVGGPGPPKWLPKWYLNGSVVNMNAINMILSVLKMPKK